MGRIAGVRGEPDEHADPVALVVDGEQLARDAGRDLLPIGLGRRRRRQDDGILAEARGETLVGQVAVAEVILNRRDSGKYPATVCGVVEQGTGEKYMCQFSYYCDGLSDEIGDRDAWAQVGRVARVMMDGAPRDLTNGAMFYHTKAVEPYWADEFYETAEIGAHLFYREDEVRMIASASRASSD
jgi:hypothetical protein